MTCKHNVNLFLEDLLAFFVIPTVTNHEFLYSFFGISLKTLNTFGIYFK